MQRTYDFIEVCGWFAARCDLILLLFDPAKLDISDEMKQVFLLSSISYLFQMKLSGLKASCGTAQERIRKASIGNTLKMVTGTRSAAEGGKHVCR